MTGYWNADSDRDWQDQCGMYDEPEEEGEIEMERNNRRPGCGRPSGRDRMTKPFVLSIESLDGEVRIHGFHLGTDEAVAREIAAEMWGSTRELRTVALMRDGRIVDVFDGRWSSDCYYTE